MANNIAGYISNLGKSVAYSAIDRVKSSSPTVGEFSNTNAELFKSMYTNIRDYKGTYVKGLDVVKRSKVYEAADVGMKSIFEDIKSGRLYNKEREDKIASKIMGFGDDSSSEFGDFDDSSFDIGGDDDFGSWDDESISSGDKMVSSSINQASKNNAEMVSMVVAKTGEHVAETQKRSTHLLYTQNMQAYNLFNSNLASINSNISSMLSFSTNTIQSHAENSQKYFEKTEALMTDQTALLRQIVGLLSPKEEKQKEKKHKTNFGDIVGANGAPDLTEYFNVIKKNIGDQMGAAGSFSGMFGEDSNALLSFVSSPLKFIPNMIVNSLIPKTIDKSMEQLDQSLSGFFGSLISKFNTMAKSEDNFFTSTIGKIFGVRNTVKGDINTSNYNKGKVDWDGKSRKALIEVIPTQLAKIVSLLSGKSERIFDYDKGQFIESKDIEENRKKDKKSYVKRATGDMDDKFKEYMNKMTFDSLQDKESLTEDIEKFFTQLYSSGEMVNLNGKDAKDEYLKYGVSQKNFAAIRAMYKKSSKGLQHNINKQVLEYRDRQNKDMMDMEENSDSINQYLFNNAKLGEFVEKDKKFGGMKSNSLLASGSLTTMLDNKGKNIFFYLQNIYKELSFIRRFGSDEQPTNISSPKIITRNDDVFTPSHNLDEIVINDTSKKSKVTLDREEREKKIKHFERQEKKRREKDKSLVNVSTIDNEKELENTLSSMIDMEKLKEDIKENDTKKPNMLEKLLQADNISGKIEIVVDRLNGLSKKPLDFFTKTIDKVDQRLYEVIYGKEGKDGRDIKGFIDVMVLEMKSTFGKFNLWMDEKVLQPLKDKLDITSFGDIGKKFLAMFGIDGEDIGKSIKKYLFGDKDKGEDGIFSSVTKGIKDSFRGVFSTIKDSLKNAYGPLFGKMKKAFGRQNKFQQLDEEDREIEGSDTIDWANASEETKARERKRQQNVKIYDKNSTRIKNSGLAKNHYNEIMSEQSEEDKMKFYRNDIAALENYRNIDLTKNNSSITDLIYNLSTDKTSRDSTDEELELSTLIENYTSPDNNHSKSNMYKRIEKLQRSIERKKKNKLNYDSKVDDILKIQDLSRNKEDYETNSTAYNQLLHNSRSNALKKVHYDKYVGSIDESQFDYTPKTAEEQADRFTGLFSDPSIESEDSYKTSSLFSKLGDRFDESVGYFRSIKDTLLDILNIMKPKQSKLIGPRISGLEIPTSSNPLLQEEDAAIGDMATSLGNIISNSVFKFMKGGMNQFADGGYVDKAQVATIGKGEVVLSKENTDNLVTMMSGLLDALKGGKKGKSDIANSAFGPLMKLDEQIGGFKDLTILDDLVVNNSILKDKFTNLTDKSGYDTIMNYLENQMKEDRNTEVDDKGVPIDPVKKAAFLETRPFISKVGEEFVNGTKSVRDALFGSDEKKDKQSFGLAMDDVMTNVSKYAPEATGSALIGGGVSLITGAIGGPLLGAAVGAGISLTKNSEKMQNWLFGEEGEDNKRQGGVISKSLMDGVGKYLPDFKTYGIAGAATGLLPFLPFGPLGGLMMGSAFTFAKNNEAVQNKLFGEEGMFKPEAKDKLKKILPRLGLGAAAGLIMGPFGIMGNALLGSGIGLASTTDKFSQLIIGEKDSEGKYKGGLLPTLKEAVVDPIKGYMKDLGKRIFDFVKEDMFKPLASAFAPMKKTVELLTRNMFDSVGGFMNKMFEESFGVPLNKLLEEKIIKPLSNGIGSILKVGKNITKAVISAPFKAIGGIGNAARKKQIRNGTADYMTAEERLKFREEKNIHTLGLFGDDKTFAQDSILANMDKDKLSSILGGLNKIKDNNANDLKSRQMIAKDMVKDIYPNFKHKESKNLMKAIRDGDKKDVFEYIENSNKFTPEQKENILSSLKKNTDRFSEISKLNNRHTEDKVGVYAALEKAGFKVNDSNIRDYINLLTKEDKSRNKNKIVEPKDIEKSDEEKAMELGEKNHEQVIDKFDEAIILLKKMVDPDFKEKETTIADKESVVKRPKDDVKAALKKVKPENKKTEIVNGVPLDYKKNARGEWELDNSDAENREYTEQVEEDRENQNNFYTRFQSLFEQGKEKANNAVETVKEKGKGLLGSIIGSVAGMVTKAGPFLKIGGMIIAGISAFIKTPNGDNLLLEIGKKLANMVFGRISDMMGFDNKEDTIKNAAGVVAREVATGGSAVKFGSKWLAKMVKPKDLSNKSMLGKIGHYINPTTLAKGVVKTPINMAFKGVEAASTGVKNLYAKLGGNKLSTFKDAIIAKGNKYLAKGADVAKDSIDNSSFISSMVSSMDDFMQSILKNKAVKAILKDKAEVIATKAVPSILKEVAENAAKAGSKALTKVIGGLSTGGILNVAWAVADFVSGFNSAKKILDIVQEPTFGMKVCSGLIKALNGLFIITAFISEKTWVNLILDKVMPLLGKEDLNIQKLRNESDKIVNEYNETNNTEYSVSEYNNETNTSFTQKIKNGISNIGKSVKSSFKKFTDKFKNKGVEQYPSSIPGGKGGKEEKPKARSIYNYGGKGESCFAGKGKEEKPKARSIYNYGGKGEINGYSDIRDMELNKDVKDKVTAEEINAWVNPYAGEGSGMYNIGKTALRAQKETGLDARYIVAHAAEESGWGKSEIARKKNNYFGIGAFNASPGESAHTFSKEDGLVEGAKWINHNYAKQGQNTLNSMIHSGGHVYAQYDDGTPNEDWADNIASIMNHPRTIKQGSINKSAKWNGVWADSNYSSGSSYKEGESTDDIGSETKEEKPASIFNFLEEMSTAFGSGFKKYYGLEDEEEQGNEGTSTPSNNNSPNPTSDGRKVNDFAYFSQKEDPWASYKYKPSPGVGEFSDPTIRERGCGPTSAAMVVKELTGDKSVTPISMANFASANGESVEDGTSWGFYSKVAKEHGLNVTETNVNPATLSTVTKQNPMIISGTGGPFFGGHFMVATKGGNGQVVMNDPLGEDRSRAFSIPEMMKYARNGWSYSKGGGKGDNKEDKPKPQIKPPKCKMPDCKQEPMAGKGDSSNYNKLLMTIIEVLLKISDNSAYLSKIVDILSNKLGVDIPDETKQAIKSNTKGSKQQIINIIKESATSSPNPDNEYLLNILDGLATQ